MAILRTAIALVLVAGPAAISLDLGTRDVYATGDVVPGLPGVRFVDSTGTSFGQTFVDLAANDAGDVAVEFVADGVSPFPNLNDVGVVSTSRGLLARTGDPVVGSFSDTCLGFDDLDIAGEVVFGALVDDAPNALVSSDRGQLVTVGDPVPGIPGATFTRLTNFDVAAAGAWPSWGSSKVPA